jgi:hypothetical protein
VTDVTGSSTAEDAEVNGESTENEFVLGVLFVSLRVSAVIR